MADFKPTVAQQCAINTRGGTVLVSAGAGSGKTKVLTERLMGFVTDAEHPADLDSFLIITFTRAAAGELLLPSAQGESYIAADCAIPADCVWNLSFD